jgi:proline iminopeptidase
MPYIKHRLGRTYYQSAGKKSSAVPLIALHGGPGGTSSINELFLKLAGDRKVFIYDQLGGGKSGSTPKSKWTMKTFVEELKLLVNAWNLDQFHLFGISCGSTLALEYFAATRDQRIKSIIFQSPFFSVSDWTRDAKKLITKLPKKHQKVIKYCHEIGATDSEVYQQALEAYYLKHVIRNKKAFKSRKAGENPNGKKIYEYMWGPSEFCPTGTLKTYERAHKLKSINKPTLFICGRYDEAAPSTVGKYHRLVKKSKFKIIPKASHAIAKEQPKALLKTVKDYLIEVDNFM